MTVLAWTLALLLAALAAFADLRLEELLLTAVLTLAFSMVFGTLQPARPWRWALVFGLAVPAAHLLMRLTGWLWVDPVRLPAALALVLVGFVGAYGGAFFRRMVQNLLQSR
jgi:hypothetical protein